ncbi:MAG: ABC transporter permease [Nitrospira sp.]|nr:MAG: ABC transporter permease [Nitrospira sp.]
MSSRAPDNHTILIKPLQGWEPLRLRDIWEHRELLYFLIWRDIKVSYARTNLGVGWALLKPVLTMIVFTFIFGWLTQLPSDGVPYPIFVYAGLLPWQLFARLVSGAGSSMVANESLVTKVYFPRLIAPLSITVVGTLDFVIAVGVLLGMMWYYQIALTAGVWVLPLLVAVTIAAGLGLGLWIAALNVLCRDIGHAQPFLIQCWMFATPIIYPTSLIPEAWRTLYALNPMVGVVEGFREALFRTGGQSDSMMGMSLIVAGVLLVSGLYVFNRIEQSIADTV